MYVSLYYNSIALCLSRDGIKFVIGRVHYFLNNIDTNQL